MAERRPSRNWAAKPSHAGTQAQIIAVVAAIVVVGGLMIGFDKLSRDSRVPTAADTLCRVEQPPTEVLVLLLDMSDKFTEAQRLKVEHALNRLQSEVPRFGLIEVYAVDGSVDTLIRPVLSLCNPGRGDELNRLYQNPDLARKKWEGFTRSLTTETMRLLSTTGASSSPIMEAIQATGLRTFNQPRYEGLQKRLVVVSDLLQHVPGRMSHYRNIPSFDEFKQTPYFTEVRGGLASLK